MMEKAIILVFFSALCLTSAVPKPKSSKCISTGYHKQFSSPEKNLEACQRYSHNACCSRSVTLQIASADQKMGNFSWNLCGNLSKSCHKMFRRMECFYQCEPYLGLWAHSSRFGGIYRVPICPHFCNSWFEACKDDMTCVRNWLGDYEMEKGWKNKCPEDSVCKKFSDFFVNGKDMCQTIWGDSLQYAQQTCFDVDFEGQNPNWQVVAKTLERESIHHMKLIKTTAKKKEKTA